MRGRSAHDCPSHQYIPPIFAAKPGTIQRRRWLTKGLLYLLAIVGAAASLGPFLWSISGSLMTDIEVAAYPPQLFPDSVQWQNYLQVWTAVPFGSWAFNSLLVAGVGTLGAVLSATVVAFSFARFRYPGRNLLFLIVLSTLMLPTEVTLIPQYLLFRELKWLDTLLPLIVPEFLGGGAFNIFLMRQFLMSIPRDLDEAAYLDGARSWQILWFVLMPLAKPALATMAVISVINHWNEFLQPLIYLNTVENYTLAVGIRFFQLAGIPNVLTMNHLLLAAAVIMTLPIVLLFFVAQNYFVRGIVMSGIKG